MSYIRQVCQWVVFGNIWLAVGAFFLSLQTSVLIGAWNPILALYYGFVFSGTWCLYTLHNLATLHLGTETAFHSIRWVFIRSRQSIWKTIAIGSFLISSCCFFLLPRTIQWQLVWPGMLAFLYLAPIFPEKRRLRDIPWVKGPVIALVWAILTALIPAGISGCPLPVISLVALTVERFFFVLALALPFDIRDQNQDMRQGNATLPAKIGGRATRILALSALGISASLVFLNMSLQQYRPLAAAAICVSLVLCGFLIGNAHSERPEWFFSFGIDGMLILQPVLVFAAIQLPQ